MPAGTVIGRTWRTLLTLRPGMSGPVAVRHAPYLATGELGTLGAPFSSIQYPTGLRGSLVATTGGTIGGSHLTIGDEDEAGCETNGEDLPELARLRADVAAFAGLSPARQAEVLACLNCITEHRAAFRALRALTDDHFASPDGCAALYEAARSLVRVRPQDPQSRRALGRLARQDVNPVTATAAAVQLGAASIRLDRDLDAGDDALALADARLTEVAGPGHRFVAVLLASRIHRARALWALRQRDFPLLSRCLEGALATASDLMEAAPVDDPYATLVAAENLRLVLEAHLVAASGSGRADAFGGWAARLLDTDPEDPFTWRYLAIYGARCGLLTGASLAVAGLAAMTTVGLADAAEAVQRAEAGTASPGGTGPDGDDGEFESLVLAALHRLLRPGSLVPAA
jgi:hypothetical protein